MCRYKYVSKGVISQKNQKMHEDIKFKVDLFLGKPLCISF